jgi:hypothetical protein
MLLVLQHWGVQGEPPHQQQSHDKAEQQESCRQQAGMFGQHNYATVLRSAGFTQVVAAPFLKQHSLHTLKH